MERDNGCIPMQATKTKRICLAYDRQRQLSNWEDLCRLYDTCWSTPGSRPELSNWHSSCLLLPFALPWRFWACTKRIGHPNTLNIHFQGIEACSSTPLSQIVDTDGRTADHLTWIGKATAGPWQGTWRSLGVFRKAGGGQYFGCDWCPGLRKWASYSDEGLSRGGREKSSSGLLRSRGVWFRQVDQPVWSCRILLVGASFERLSARVCVCWCLLGVSVKKEKKVERG